RRLKNAEDEQQQNGQDDRNHNRTEAADSIREKQKHDPATCAQLVGGTSPRYSSANAFPNKADDCRENQFSHFNFL
ncbi:MAG TPA: hypothetical protein VE421_03900, partial [Burkholderiaceae bacterium]|nr:hypothetical protein [Burkholderiaceae bacterium]